MNKELKDVYGFIYITTNLINGKRYIGQKKFEEGSHLYRWKSYLGSGVLLNKAIDKYGKENFTRDIVAVAYNEEELNQLEIEWINNYDAINNDSYYNIAEGGRKNPLAGKTEEEISEIRKKIRESVSKVIDGKNHPNFGKKTKEETKRKISESLKGKPLSEERKRNISLALRKKYSEGKISNKTRINRKNKNRVMCITTGVVYNSLKEASEKTGADLTSISKCCNGKRKTAGSLPDGTRLTWKVIDCEVSA